jgi:hypothetical protein
MIKANGLNPKVGPILSDVDVYKSHRAKGSNPKVVPILSDVDVYKTSHRAKGIEPRVYIYEPLILSDDEPLLLSDDADDYKNRSQSQVYIYMSH